MGKLVRSGRQQAQHRSASDQGSQFEIRTEIDSGSQQLYIVTLMRIVYLGTLTA
jgi:hypothetical protein